MFILNPVSYDGTIHELLSGSEHLVRNGVFDVQVPGMLSLSATRLAMACKDLPLRRELLARESKQRFGAGDYFLLGDPQSICIITVGVDQNPASLESFVSYAKSLEEGLVCLSDLENDPAMEVFLDVISEHLAVQRLSLEEIRNYHQ